MSATNDVDKKVRATCWSITINNPTQEDYEAIKNIPAGWSVLGQPEVGEEGTPHLQLCIKTPQVRWSAVKKHFVRGHIEVARNQKALTKYVQKEETRAGDLIQVKSQIPTIFEYQTIIAKQWIEDDFQERLKRSLQVTKVPDIDEVAMCYIDSLVSADIRSGRRGAEWISINPMWRCSWKKFWRDIIIRDGPGSQAEGSEEASVSPPAQNAEAQEQ